MLQPQIIRLTRLVLTHQSHFFLSIFNSHKNKKDTTKTHRRPLPSDIRHKDTLSNKVVQKTDQRAHSTPKFYKEGNTDKTSARVEATHEMKKNKEIEAIATSVAYFKKKALNSSTTLEFPEILTNGSYLPQVTQLLEQLELNHNILSTIHPERLKNIFQVNFPTIIQQEGDTMYLSHLLTWTNLCAKLIHLGYNCNSFKTELMKCSAKLKVSRLNSMTIREICYFFSALYKLQDPIVYKFRTYISKELISNLNNKNIETPSKKSELVNNFLNYISNYLTYSIYEEKAINIFFNFLSNNWHILNLKSNIIVNLTNLCSSLESQKELLTSETIKEIENLYEKIDAPMKMFKLVDIENIFAQPYPLGIQKYIIEKFNKNFWKSVSVADINKYTSMQLKKIKICLCILSWNSLGLEPTSEIQIDLLFKLLEKLGKIPQHNNKYISCSYFKHCLTKYVTFCTKLQLKMNYLHAGYIAQYGTINNLYAYIKRSESSSSPCYVTSAVILYKLHTAKLTNKADEKEYRQIIENFRLATITTELLYKYSIITSESLLMADFVKVFAKEFSVITPLTNKCFIDQLSWIILAIKSNNSDLINQIKLLFSNIELKKNSILLSILYSLSTANNSSTYFESIINFLHFAVCRETLTSAPDDIIINTIKILSICRTNWEELIKSTSDASEKVFQLLKFLLTESSENTENIKIIEPLLLDYLHRKNGFNSTPYHTFLLELVKHFKLFTCEYLKSEIIKKSLHYNVKFNELILEQLEAFVTATELKPEDKKFCQILMGKNVLFADFNISELFLLFRLEKINELSEFESKILKAIPTLRPYAFEKILIHRAKSTIIKHKIDLALLNRLKEIDFNTLNTIYIIKEYKNSIQAPLTSKNILNIVLEHYEQRISELYICDHIDLLELCKDEKLNKFSYFDKLTKYATSINHHELLNRISNTKSFLDNISDNATNTTEREGEHSLIT